MKKQKYFLLLLIIVIAGFSSDCKKLKDALDKNFTTDETELTFTINPASTGEHTFALQVVSSDIIKQITDAGGDVGKIKSIKINECVFEVVSQGRNFDEFQSFDLYLSDGSADPVKVAWIDNIPENSFSQTLTLVDQDFKDLLNGDTYNVTIKGVLDKNLETALDVKAKIKYSITVGLL
jgi:hypothetical protein